MSKLPKFNITRSNTPLPELYHLSVKSVADEGVWNPDDLSAFDESQESSPGVVGDPSFPYPEPSFARISVAPTIEQAFRGIYPGVADMFKVKKYPYLEYSVFKPMFTGKENLVLPTELTVRRMVWDACVTQETCILDPIHMRHIGRVRIFNTNASPTMYIHPFGDTKNPVESVGPAIIRWQWIGKRL